MVVLIVFLIAVFQYKSLGCVLNYCRQLQMLSTSHTVSREEARTELDYYPHVPFDEAFRQFSQWYLLPLECFYLEYEQKFNNILIIIIN